VAATATQFVTPLFARKATDEGRANTTTLADDSSLQLPGMISGAIYEISGVLFYDGGTGGSAGNLKWKFTVPSGSVMLYSYARQNVSHVYSGAFGAQGSDTINADTTGVGATMTVTIRGIVVAGSNGTLKFQWAQDNAASGPTPTSSPTRS
jgi:hypothetical protein